MLASSMCVCGKVRWTLLRMGQRLFDISSWPMKAWWDGDGSQISCPFVPSGTPRGDGAVVVRTASPAERRDRTSDVPEQSSTGCGRQSRYGHISALLLTCGSGPGGDKNEATFELNVLAAARKEGEGQCQGPPIFSGGGPVLQGRGECPLPRSGAGVAESPSGRFGVPPGATARRTTATSHEFRERSSAAAAAFAWSCRSSGSLRFTCFMVPLLS